MARVYQAKVANLPDPKQIPEDSQVGPTAVFICALLITRMVVQEVNERSSAILLTEEVLLEALCFDFCVESPHAELVDLFESCGSPSSVQEFAWSLAHDS